MAETSDLQQRFDALVGDVARVAPGDSERPVRIARRRRRVRSGLAVAAAVAVVAGVIGGGVVARDDGGNGVDPADRGQQHPGRSGPLGRDSLLRWLPADANAVYLADVEAFTGKAGLDVAGGDGDALAGYVPSTFLTLAVQPFFSLAADRLVTYVGTDSVDYLVLDADAGRVESRVRAAGWEPAGDGLLTPGPDVRSRRPALSAARFVRIEGTDVGLTFLGLARKADDLPDVVGDAPPEAGLAAQRLLGLGGAVGVSLGARFDSQPCSFTVVSLDSPTEGTALLTPPDGEAPRDVTAAQIGRLDGVTGVSGVSAEGDRVRADLELEGPSVPYDLLRRLGLPGSTYCG